MELESQEVRYEAAGDDRNKGGVSRGGEEVTGVRVTGEKNHPDFSLLAVNCFANARNWRQCSSAITLIVFGARQRHTWCKSPTLSLIL